MSQVMNALGMKNIEAVIDRSEPDCGFMQDVIVPLLSVTASSSRSLGLPLLLGTDVGGIGGLSLVALTGWNTEGSDASTGMTVLEMCNGSTINDGFYVPWTVPGDAVCGAGSGVWAPSFQLGVAHRAKSGTAQATLRLNCTTTYRPSEGTSAAVSLAALQSDAYGSTLATTGGFNWTWYNIFSGATAAQKASIVAGTHMEFFLSPSAELTTLGAIQISDLVIRYRRHATLKTKGDRW